MPSTNKIILPILVGIFLLLAWAVNFRAGLQSDEPDVHGLEFLTCPYPDIPRQQVTCARFTTAIEHGRFSLPIAIVHASQGGAGHKSSEALVLIPGGPGEGYQVTPDNVEYWVEWMRQAGLSRDLVLFDPRGTGESSPTWHCQEYDNQSLEWAAASLDAVAELTLSHAVLKNCLSEYDQWLKANVETVLDPHPGMGLLSSVYQAGDVNDMLAALGYDAWHLWGVSYGTRVALLAAGHEKVKTVLLDSPYPLDKGRLSEWPALLDGAMTKHEQIYQALYRDKAKHTDFRDLWKAVILRLDNAPARFPLHYWNAGREDSLALVLNSDRLLSVAYFVLYDTSLWQPFYEGLEYLEANLPTPTDGNGPQKVVAGWQGGQKQDSLKLVLEAFASSTFDPLFNSMVYFAVECEDNPVDAESLYLDELNKYPRFARFMQNDWQYDICREAFFDNRDPVSRQPLADKPTLILSGQYDPVTPKEWGMELQRQLGAHARFHMIGGAGHGVTVNDACDMGLFEAFMNGAELDLARTCGDIQLTWP